MDRDLLPWILGAVLIATGAIAAAVQFGGHASSVATAASTPSVSSAPPSTASNLPVNVPAAAAPASEAAPASAPTPAPAVTPPPPAPSAPTGGSASELPSGEVWQCTVNGQKIFSDKRCGTGASVRQLSDPNVMDAPVAPAQGAYGMYPPGYGGGAYPPSYPDDQDDAGSAGDVYPGQPIIVARERARREQLAHRDHHARPPPNRAAAGSRNPR